MGWTILCFAFIMCSYLWLIWQDFSFSLWQSLAIRSSVPDSVLASTGNRIHIKSDHHNACWTSRPSISVWAIQWQILMWFDISVAIGQHHNALAELQDQFAEICEGWDWPGADPTLSCPALHTRLGFSPPQFHHKPSHEISPALCGNHNCIKPDFGLFCDFLMMNYPGQSPSLALDSHTREKPTKQINVWLSSKIGLTLALTVRA